MSSDFSVEDITKLHDLLLHYYMPEAIIDGFYRLDPIRNKGSRDYIPFSSSYSFGDGEKMQTAALFCTDYADIKEAALLPALKLEDKSEAALSDALRRYVVGFNAGYNTFQSHVSKQIEDLPTEDNKVNAIFQFATNYRQHARYSSFFFEPTGKGGVIYGDYTQSGEYVGKLFKAWEIIFKNWRLFESIFTASKHTPITADVIPGNSDQKPTGDRPKAPAKKQLKATETSTKEDQPYSYNLIDYMGKPDFSFLVNDLVIEGHITQDAQGVKWKKSKPAGPNLCYLIIALRNSPKYDLPDTLDKLLNIANNTFGANVGMSTMYTASSKADSEDYRKLERLVQGLSRQSKERKESK